MLYLHHRTRNITPELQELQSMVERLEGDLPGGSFATLPKADRDAFQMYAAGHVRDRIERQRILGRGTPLLVRGEGGLVKTGGRREALDFQRITGTQVLHGLVSWPIVGLVPSIDVLLRREPMTPENSQLSVVIGLTDAKFGEPGSMKDTEGVLLPLAYKELKVYKY